MKILVWSLSFLVWGAFDSRGQEFINLDFEQANLSDPRMTPSMYSWDSAAPGWGHSKGADTGGVYVGSRHLGVTQMFILATGMTKSGFSFYIQSGIFQSNVPDAPWVNAFISQSGTVPADAEVIRLSATGLFKVLLSDTEIPMTNLGSNNWTGDVRPFAGQLAELKIVNTTTNYTWLRVDNIAFRRAVRSEILWQNVNGSLARWSLENITFYSSQLISNAFPANWRLIGEANSNDGNALLFQSQAGVLGFQMTNDTGSLSVTLLRNGRPVNSGWKALSTSDVNNDDSPDILFQHEDGRLALWLMQGTNFSSAVLLKNGNPARDLRAVATADFNGDSEMDILFQTMVQKLVVWFGPDFESAVTIRDQKPIASGWRASGVIDRVDENGSSGILFQYTGGRVALWRMNGTNFLGAIPLRQNRPVAAGWKIAGAK